MPQPKLVSKLLLCLLATAVVSACATTPKKHVAKKAKKHHSTETAENFGLYKQDNLNKGLLRQGEKNIGSDNAAL